MEKVIEKHLTTNVFLVHPEGHEYGFGALGRLRTLGQERGKDLRGGSEVRQGEDGLWRVYELESSTTELESSITEKVSSITGKV